MDVEVGDLAFVVEGLHGESFHRVDLVFLCTYLGEISGAQIHGDTNQVGVEWLDLEGLEDKPLYPSKLRSQIRNLYRSRKTPIYLGDESMGS